MPHIYMTNTNVITEVKKNGTVRRADNFRAVSERRGGSEEI
jgi:hypothetical protein